MEQRFEVENYSQTTVAYVQDVPSGRDQAVCGCAQIWQAVFRGKPHPSEYNIEYIKLGTYWG